MQKFGSEPEKGSQRGSLCDLYQDSSQVEKGRPGIISCGAGWLTDLPKNLGEVPVLYVYISKKTSLTTPMGDIWRHRGNRQ